MLEQRIQTEVPSLSVEVAVLDIAVIDHLHRDAFEVIAVPPDDAVGDVRRPRQNKDSASSKHAHVVCNCVVDDFRRTVFDADPGSAKDRRIIRDKVGANVRGRGEGEDSTPEVVADVADDAVARDMRQRAAVAVDADASRIGGPRRQTARDEVVRDDHWRPVGVHLRSVQVLLASDGEAVNNACHSIERHHVAHVCCDDDRGVVARAEEGDVRPQPQILHIGARSDPNDRGCPGDLNHRLDCPLRTISSVVVRLARPVPGVIADLRVDIIDAIRRVRVVRISPQYVFTHIAQAVFVRVLERVVHPQVKVVVVLPPIRQAVAVEVRVERVTSVVNLVSITHPVAVGVRVCGVGEIHPDFLEVGQPISVRVRVVRVGRVNINLLVVREAVVIRVGIKRTCACMFGVNKDARQILYRIQKSVRIAVGCGVLDVVWDAVSVNVAVGAVVACRVRGVRSRDDFPPIRHPVAVCVGIQRVGPEGDFIAVGERVTVRIPCEELLHVGLAIEITVLVRIIGEGIERESIVSEGDLPPVRHAVAVRVRIERVGPCVGQVNEDARVCLDSIEERVSVGVWVSGVSPGIVLINPHPGVRLDDVPQAVSVGIGRHVLFEVRQAVAVNIAVRPVDSDGVERVGPVGDFPAVWQSVPVGIPVQRVRSGVVRVNEDSRIRLVDVQEPIAVGIGSAEILVNVRHSVSVDVARGSVIACWVGWIRPVEHLPSVGQTVVIGVRVGGVSSQVRLSVHEGVVVGVNPATVTSHRDDAARSVNQPVTVCVHMQRIGMERLLIRRGQTVAVLVIATVLIYVRFAVTVSVICAVAHERVERLGWVKRGNKNLVSVWHSIAVRVPLVWVGWGRDVLCRIGRVRDLATEFVPIVETVVIRVGVKRVERRFPCDFLIVGEAVVIRIRVLEFIEVVGSVPVSVRSGIIRRGVERRREDVVGVQELVKVRLIVAVSVLGSIIPQGVKRVGVVDERNLVPVRHSVAIGITAAGVCLEQLYLREIAYTVAVRVRLPPIRHSIIIRIRLVWVAAVNKYFDAIGQADWVIEAIIENLKIKRGLMERIDAVRKPACIVSTNTSGIPVASIAAGRSESFNQHFLGTHFFNPPRY